jgi:hypothetical protein
MYFLIMVIRTKINVLKLLPSQGYLMFFTNYSFIIDFTNQLPKLSQSDSF